MFYNFNNTNRTKCLCDCECGNCDILRDPYTLKHAKYSSCGCGKKDYIIKSCGKDIVGQKFGKLLVLDIIWNSTPPQVKCLCDCGNVVIRNKKDVQNNHTKSCGCLKTENLDKINNVDHTGKVSDYGIEILREFQKNDKGQTLWECKCFCGNLFSELPARILNGHVRSCGCLNRSSREIYIENLLIENNLNYATQYTFKDCKSDKNYVLRFDFAIFDNEHKLLLLIEYDGQQHFYPIDYFGGESGFVEIQKRDNIKNKYCIENGIPLIRLNYKMSETEIRDKIVNILYP